MRISQNIRELRAQMQKYGNSNMMEFVLFVYKIQRVWERKIYENTTKLLFA